MIAANTPATDLPTIRTNIYDRRYWLLYVGNLSFVTANALTYRFAELVSYLGGNEQLTGTIVSIGLMAALAVRFRLGQEIDRYGTRKLWTASAVLFVTGCLMFLLAHRLSWHIYVARVAFAVGVAASFTCSVVYLQNRVPPHRRAEIVGNLGTGGFLGMVLGALLGDWILYAVPPGATRFTVLFGSATGLGVVYFLLVEYLSRQDTHHRPKHTPPVHHLAVRFWPGNVLLVSMMMGIGLTVTTVFLTRFATERHLNGIGTFFLGYCIFAFLFRIWARHWSLTMGRHRMIYLGLAGHCIGYLILPTVTTEWGFILPSIACGFGHALLFPAVVTLGSQSFPSEYRGTGTTVVLGFTDMGALIFAPILGSIIDQFGFPAMFYTAGTTAVLIGAIYAFSDGRRSDADFESDLSSDTMECETVGQQAEPSEAEPSVA